jgi:PPOX class probable F420-dependent enzyme
MEKLGHLRAVRNVLLTTRDASGAAVNAVAQVAVVDDDTAYFRTHSGSGLASRLAAVADLRIAPCDFLGRAGGSDQPCRAEPVWGVDATVASRALVKKYPILQGLLFPLAYRLRGAVAVLYRVLPTDEPTPWM